MATRSLIAVQHTSGEVSEIYCHFDGYLEHNGKLLSTYYNSIELAEELIAHGDMSVLKPNIHPSTNSHSFESPERDVCIFYGRDRGEQLTIPNNYTSLGSWRRDDDKDIGVEFNYIFKEGAWFVGHNKTHLTKLQVL